MKSKTAAQIFAESIDDSPNIFPKGTEAQKALEIIAEHLLGKDGCIVSYPCGATQWNSEVTFAILNKYKSGKLVRVPKEKKHD